MFLGGIRAFFELILRDAGDVDALVRDEVGMAGFADLDVVDDVGNLFQRDVDGGDADRALAAALGFGRDGRCECDHDGLGRGVKVGLGQKRLALAGVLAAGIPVFFEVGAAFLHVVEIGLEPAVFAERERADELLVRAIGVRLEPEAAAVGEGLLIELVDDVFREILLALVLVVIASVVGHVVAGDFHLVQHFVDFGAVRFQRLLHAARGKLGNVAVAAVGGDARDDDEADEDGRQQDQAHLELDAVEAVVVEERGCGWHGITPLVLFLFERIEFVIYVFAKGRWGPARET